MRFLVRLLGGMWVATLIGLAVTQVRALRWTELRPWATATASNRCLSIPASTS